jgi:hypothetical protein
MLDCKVVRHGIIISQGMKQRQQSMMLCCLFIPATLILNYSPVHWMPATHDPDAKKLVCVKHSLKVRDNLAASIMGSFLR